MRPVQLGFPGRGGKRKGAGRKPKPGLRRVSHKPRPPHAARFPIHAVWRTRNDVPSLRRRELVRAVREALAAGGQRTNFRVVHFSIQGNHIHLVVESSEAVALSRGMQGLAVRIARAINRVVRRSGKVFADHYFARELKTPAEVRRAVRYVLDNFLLHAALVTPQTDSCAGQVATSRTWLLGVGWQRSRAGPLPVAYWPR